MSLFGSVLYHDVCLSWRSSLGHPGRRRTLWTGLVAVGLLHLLPLLAGPTVPGLSPGLVSVAFGVYIFGRAPADCLETMWLSPQAGVMHLAAVNWVEVITARLLSQCLVHTALLLTVVSPVLLRNFLFTTPYALMGYLALPVLALAYYALTWALITPLLFWLGDRVAQSVAQCWRYLVMAVGGLLMVRPAGWVEPGLGWWAMSGRMGWGVLLTLGAASLMLWVAVLTLLTYVSRPIPRFSGRIVGSEWPEGRNLGVLLRKEWQVMLRTPKYWSGAIVFPILEVLVAVVAFGNDRLMLSAVLVVFCPALLAMVLTDYLTQHDQSHVPFLLLSPTPPRRLLLVKAVIPILVSLPMVMSGTMLAPLSLVGRTVVGLAGLSAAAYTAYITGRQGMIRVIAPKRTGGVTNVLSFLVITFMSIGVGMYIAGESLAPVAFLMGALCVIPTLRTRLRLPPQGT